MFAGLVPPSARVAIWAQLMRAWNAGHDDCRLGPDWTWPLLRG